MAEALRPILSGLGNTQFVLNLVTRDLRNEDALTRSRGDEGASISWTIGHLLCFRHTMLAAAGEESENPFEEKFGYPIAATNGSDYPSIEVLRESWNQTHEKLTAALSKLTNEELARPAPGNPPMGGQPLIDLLAFLVWHEAYHTGLIGSMRVRLGYRPTAELAMEEMAKGGSR